MKYICNFPTQFMGRIFKRGEVVDVADGTAVPASFKRVEGAADGNPLPPPPPDPSKLSEDGYRTKLEQMRVPYPANATLETLKKIHDEALGPRGKA